MLCTRSGSDGRESMPRLGTELCMLGSLTCVVAHSSVFIHAILIFGLTSECKPLPYLIK